MKSVQKPARRGKKFGGVLKLPWASSGIKWWIVGSIQVVMVLHPPPIWYLRRGRGNTKKKKEDGTGLKRETLVDDFLFKFSLIKRSELNEFLVMICIHSRSYI